MYDHNSVFKAFFFPAIGGLLYGFDIGATSSVLDLMIDPDASNVEWSSLLADSSTLQGLFISISTLGAMFGSGICFKYAEEYGRKWSLLTGALLYTISSIIIATCGWIDLGTYPGVSIFFAGNFFYGVGVGFAMHGAPAYIGEMAPSDIRGFLISMKEGLVVSGMVFGYLIGWAVIGIVGGWTYLYVFSALVGIVMFVGVSALPDSARWLATQGRGNEAMDSMMFITPSPTDTERQLVLKLVNIATLEFENRRVKISKSRAQAERRRIRALEQRKRSGTGGSGSDDSNTNVFAQITHYLCTLCSSSGDNAAYKTMSINRSGSDVSVGSNSRASEESLGVGNIGDLITPRTYPALLAGIGLVLFQQFTGQPSVLYYIDQLFEDQGISTFASVMLSLWKLVGTLGATFTVDKYGRKTLLYVGCSVMFVGLCVLIVAQHFSGVALQDCEDIGIDATACTNDAYLDGNCVWDSDSSACGLSDKGLAWTAQKIVTMMAYTAYIGGYQVGFGPISWLLISEIFPQEIRGRAVSIAILTNFAANSFCGFLLPVEVTYMGEQMAFSFYALLLIWAVYFIHHYIPETKGLSLEQISALFETQVPFSPDTGGTGGMNIDSYENGGGSGSSGGGNNGGSNYRRKGGGGGLRGGGPDGYYADDLSIDSSTSRSVGPHGGASVK